MYEWRETYRGIVFPAHCDHLGHMNARFYADPFDDAGFPDLARDRLATRAQSRAWGRYRLGPLYHQVLE